MSLKKKLKRLKETTKPEKLKDSEDGEILYGWCVGESIVDTEIIYSKLMSTEKFDELYERDPCLLNEIRWDIGQQHGLRWSEIDGELMFVLTITEEEFKNWGKDRNWELFDEEFYALLKKHTGVEFNEEPKDFDWYCSMRNKIWEDLEKKEIV